MVEFCLSPFREIENSRCPGQGVFLAEGLYPAYIGQGIFGSREV